MICTKCKIDKQTTEFYVGKNKRNDVVKEYQYKYCKKCQYKNKTWDWNKFWDSRTQEEKEKYRENARKSSLMVDRKVQLLKRLKSKALKSGLGFDLTLEDLENIPTHCPVFGWKMKFNRGHPKPNSLSVDRIDNTKGYLKSNIVFVSHLANTIKNVATVEELGKVYEFYKTLSQRV